MIKVIDDFFLNPDAVRAALLSGEYGDVAGGGGVFPGINAGVPFDVKKRLLVDIESIMDAEISKEIIFARVKHSGTGPGPTTWHTDEVMGEYAAYVYLSEKPEDVIAGTWFKQSKDIAQTLVEWKYNRLVIHDASWLHCPVPIKGWGEDKWTGRLTLNCFFNLEK